MPERAYLDIETSYEGEITIIGIFRPPDLLVQLRFPDISRAALLDALDGTDEIVTFWGHRFDLPVIARMLGVNLRDHFDNLGVVNANVFRGAQPNADELWRLRDEGFRSVVNFRRSEEDGAPEAAACADLGLRYHSLPWSGKDETIDPQLVTRFLDILDDSANLPAFVHCKRGAERTGTMIAIYRIEREGWSAEDAYAEMERYGFRSLWYGHLKRFVLEYEAGSERLR